MADVAFGGRIRAIRKALKMTQKEFADLFGVTRQQVVRWEGEKHGTTQNRLDEICEKLNITPAQFWDPEWLPGKNGEPDPLDEPFIDGTHIDGIEHLDDETRKEIEQAIRAYIRVKIAEVQERRRRESDNGK